MRDIPAGPLLFALLGIWLVLLSLSFVAALFAAEWGWKWLK